MKAPRANVVAVRFLNGESVSGLSYDYRTSPDVIEQCLRRHLERLLAKKQGKR
jgi:hypothetical protein